jgi:hypothetical protein
VSGQGSNVDKPQPDGRSQTMKNYPPSFTEFTERRRIKSFSANLDVCRREILLLCFL